MTHGGGDQISRALIEGEGEALEDYQEGRVICIEGVTVDKIFQKREFYSLFPHSTAPTPIRKERTERIQSIQMPPVPQRRPSTVKMPEPEPEKSKKGFDFSWVEDFKKQMSFKSKDGKKRDKVLSL